MLRFSVDSGNTLGRGAKSELGCGREGLPSVAATVVKQMLYSWMMEG